MAKEDIKLALAKDLEKISANVTTMASQLDEIRLQTYSTTPQRIGTWIDDTPIWRVAIYQNSTTEPTSGTRGFGRIYAGGLGVISLEGVSLLGVNIMCECGLHVGTGSIASTTIRAHSGSGERTVIAYSLSCDNSNITLNGPEDETVIKGYVEFVTSEENIRLQEE